MITMKKGVLLINLGTPDTADTKDVRRYLAEFLSDSRVIDLPALIRYPLLYGLILPFRPKKSAKAYQAIWTEQGSPLLMHSKNLQNKLQLTLGSEWQVSLGMRYGSPSIKTALEELRFCEHLTILPLFPQYSSAANGSAIERTLDYLKKQNVIPSIEVIRDFYQAPAFIDAQAAIIKPWLKDHDHLLLSYHGVPERHIIRSGCASVCENACPELVATNQGCYRGQCYGTSKALALALNLSTAQYTTAFQSRLGKTPWIKPYTDEVLTTLAQQGIKRLAIACPSFVADCLETLEEIGIRANEQWLALGGEKLTLIPAVNDDDRWVSGLCELIQKTEPK